jgi:glycosyltransferase involved in cell wall biosynthesis
VILNVMLAAGFGGLEQVFLDYQEALSRYAAQRGTVCLPVAREKGEAMQRLQASGIVGRALIPHTDWDPISRAGARRLVRSLSPRVVVCHGQRAYRLMAAAVDPETALVACLHKPKFDVDLRRTTYICVSPHLAELVLTAGAPAERVHVVLNTVRWRPLPPEGRRPPERTRPLVVSAGRLHLKKGFDLLMRATARLRDTGLHFDVVIAGEGPERPALQALIGGLGLEDRVRLPGWVEDVPSFLAGADLFAMPSHQEGRPLVLLEAMAAGLPIVASDIDGIREVLPNGRLGVLTPADDEAALADAIALLLGDPARAAALGEAAHEAVRTEHSMDQLEQRLSVVLDPLLAAAAGAQGRR